MTSTFRPHADAALRGAIRLAATARAAWPAATQNRFVAIGAALILAIALGDWVIVEMERDASFAAHEATTTLLGRGMAAQTSARLGAIDRVLKDLPLALGLDQLEAPEAIKARLRARASADIVADRQKRLPGAAALALFDADGRLANASADVDFSEADISKSDLFAHLSATAGAPTFVAEPQRDAMSGAWTVLLARRIAAGHGVFAGLAVAQLALADLEEFYRVAVPPRRAVTLMRDDGMILVQFPGGMAQTGLKVAALASRAPKASGCSSYHGPDIADGAPVVAAVCAIANLPLVLQATATQEDTLANWYSESRWLAMGGVATSALVVGLLGLFAQQVRRLELSETSLAAKNLQVETLHRQLDTALSNIPQGVCFFDAENRLVVSNRRYWEVYGMEPGLIQPGATLAEIVDRRLQCVTVNNYSGSEYAAWLDAIAAAGKAQNALVELSDGRTIAIQSQPMPEGGWVATHEDITERRQAEEKIAFLAKHDALTRLPNRALLMERIEAALRDVVRGKRFAVLFLDLDRFKAVNDTLGHNVGDELLRNVAARLTATVRHGCTVARLGGDEFVVLQVAVEGPENCAALANRIIEGVGAPYDIGEHEVVIGVSVGIDICGPDSASADVLLKHADLALYLSKASGRGTFRFYEPAMDSNMRNRRQMEVDLRRAIEEKQFRLHYQPVVDAASGEVCAFEALLRWDHPARGLVLPGEFLSLSEETGLIVPIGEWVFGEACRQAALWPERIRVAVNVSRAQFRAVSIVPVIQDALSASGIAPRRLEIEINETALSQNSERNLAILHQLRDFGIGIALDDFGAGASSLSLLQKFPFDKIKVDRSLIADLTIRPEAMFFVRAIVELCRSLGVDTTMEGVETFEQLSLLLEQECTQVQGYLFGRPYPPEQAAEFLSRGGLIPARRKRATAPQETGLAS